MHILVINLQRRLGNDYPIVVELTASGVYLPTRVEGVLRPETDPGRDFSTFKAHLKVLSPKDYGTALGKAVFRDAVRDAFLEARRASDGKLHVLIFVEDSELQSLHWERLCAPAKASWEFLALDDSLPFSLYLPSVIDWRFRPIGRLDLRALVVIASPKDDDKRWGLLPFDVAKAAGIAKAALGKIPCDLLAFSEGAVGPPTFEALRGRIASESYTLLHIVCHGRHIPKTGETVLYLASNDNQVDAVNGGRLIERLANLRGARGLPHFTFLSSCESAAPATGDALGGLAQRLVRDLGMPAVLAMTDLISVDTAQELTRRFYEYLWSHGEVDGALSQACAVLADRDDINVPILYTRLEGKPLFSDSLAERSLSEAEIKNGLDKAATHLAQRSPVLLPTLEAQKALLGPSAPAEDRPRALATLNRLCERAIDLSFNDLAQGKLPPEYDDRCPFRGLYPFRPEDKEFFFGREELVGRLQGRLAEGNFLAVLGASGSGKSSLVLAGLVPALREQNPKLRWAYMTPGSSPVEFLEVSLKVNEGASLLIVDQFEEAFTQCMDEAKRRVFLERVLELQKEMRVVLTMRADFWGECAPHRELASLMQSRQELVAAMDADELRRAMEKQVQKVGLRFEADLSTTVLEEVQGEPGAMPLLQHALLELWKRRHGRWLQAEEYRAIGGVRKAIAQTAETFYRELSPADQVHVRDIFLRLTKVGDERDTRQRVPLSKLTPVGADANEIQRLVKRLANEGVRLLVSDENRTTKRVEVEVAHEALIRYWPRLHDWLNQRRDLLLIRQVVGQAACDWTQSDCDRTFLLHRAKRLEQAQGLRSAQVLPLTNEENEYLNACQKADRLGKWLTYGGASLLAALIVGIVAMGWKDALDKADLLKKDADRLKEIATLNEKRAEEAETAAAEQGRLLLESRRGEYAANCNFIAQQLELAFIL